MATASRSKLTQKSKEQVFRKKKKIKRSGNQTKEKEQKLKKKSHLLIAWTSKFQSKELETHASTVLMELRYATGWSKQAKCWLWAVQGLHHSFLPCDRVFGVIECMKWKKDTVHNYHEWANLIKQKFSRVSVTGDMIFDYKSLSKTFFKPSIASYGKKHQVSKYKEFGLSATHK